MGCGASTAQNLKERAVAAGHALGDTVSDAADAARDQARAMRLKGVPIDEELQSEAARAKTAVARLDDVADMYRDWAAISSDMLLLPSLSVWRRQEGFVGSSEAAERLQHHAAWQSELARLALAWRKAVGAGCVAELRQAEKLFQGALATMRRYEDSERAAHLSRGALEKTRAREDERVEKAKAKGDEAEAAKAEAALSEGAASAAEKRVSLEAAAAAAAVEEAAACEAVLEVRDELAADWSAPGSVAQLAAEPIGTFLQAMERFSGARAAAAARTAAELAGLVGLTVTLRESNSHSSDPSRPAHRPTADRKIDSSTIAGSTTHR